MGEGQASEDQNLTYPQIHFDLGFRPLYFRKHAQIGKKKKRDKKKNRPKSSATHLHLQM